MRSVVLYDDDCGFCRWSADKLRAWDRRGRLAFATIQASDRLLSPVPPEERLDSVHVVDPDGRVWSGGPALTRLAALLPGGASLAVLGGAFPGATERAYRAVSHHRSTLGRILGEEACRVDPASGTAR